MEKILDQLRRALEAHGGELTGLSQDVTRRAEDAERQMTAFRNKVWCLEGQLKSLSLCCGSPCCLSARWACARALEKGKKKRVFHLTTSLQLSS